MKLLVSPNSVEEVYETMKCHSVDIIDVKRPAEGSLGANFPWIIKEIRELVPKSIEVSATLGDLPNLPGTASLAAYGLAHCDINYIKAGIKGPKTFDDAVFLMKQIVRAGHEVNSTIKIVAAGYADAARFGGVSPLSIPDIAAESDSDIAMLDTAIKDGKRLFDFLSIPQLIQFTEKSRDYGLQVALAGSIKKEDLPAMKEILPDIIGARGAFCEHQDRLNGHIKVVKIEEFVQIIKKIR
ncbi:MAG: (5-formylfuran-3-yl)methyl phosphate synthase [Candidatus Helarchaeota archaeon]